MSGDHQLSLKVCVGVSVAKKRENRRKGEDRSKKEEGVGVPLDEKKGIKKEGGRRRKGRRRGDVLVVWQMIDEVADPTSALKMAATKQVKIVGSSS